MIFSKAFRSARRDDFRETVDEGELGISRKLEVDDGIGRRDERPMERFRTSELNWKVSRGLCSWQNCENAFAGEDVIAENIIGGSARNRDDMRVEVWREGWLAFAGDAERSFPT